MENRKSVDQRRAAVRQFFSAHQSLLRRQGAVVSTWRQGVSRKLGPYFLLVARRHDGQQHSIYLGSSVTLAEEVRSELAALQAAHRGRRQMTRVRRQLREEFAKAKRQLDVELAAFGLHRHGNEFRGWSGLAAAATDRGDVFCNLPIDKLGKAGRS